MSAARDRLVESGYHLDGQSTRALLRDAQQVVLNLAVLPLPEAAAGVQRITDLIAVAVEQLDVLGVPDIAERTVAV